jgi:hypothetical protein
MRNLKSLLAALSFLALAPLAYARRHFVADMAMADASYAPKVYIKQGAEELVVASGGLVTVESGGTINLAAGGKLQQAGVNLPASISFAIAAGGANVSEVTVTVKDAAGAAIAEPFNFDLWLSDAATGEGLTGTTASGAVAAKAASGTDLAVLTAKKAIRVQCKATGVYVLSITDTAKTGFYVCAQVPGLGRTNVSAQLVTASYG